MQKVFHRPHIIDEAAADSLTPRRRAQGKKPGLNLILEILLTFAIFFMSVICESIASSIVMIPMGLATKFEPNGKVFGIFDPMVYQEFAGLCCTAVATFACIFLAMFIMRRKVRTFGFVKKNAVKHYLIGLAVGAVMFTVAIGICALTGSVTITFAGGANVLYLILIFIGYMFQGNEEEVVCRGFMLVSIARRYPVWVGVAYNSILFACLHLWNPGIGLLPFINLILFGVLMSLIFLKTGNIWLVSALHTSWNFVQGNVFGVLVSGGTPSVSILSSASTEAKELINGGAFGLEGGIAVTIVVTIAILITAFCVKPSEE